MNNRQACRRVLFYCNPTLIIYLFLIVLSTVIIAISNIAEASVLKNAIDLANESYDGTQRIIVLFFTIVLGKSIVRYGLRMLQVRSNEIANKMLKIHAFNAVFGMPLVAMESFHSGDIFTRLHDDIDTIAKTTTIECTNLIGQILKVLAALIYMITLDWRITIVLVALGPLILLFSRIVTSKIRRQSQRLQESKENLASTIQETIRLIVPIKTDSIGDFVFSKIVSAINTKQQSEIGLSRTINYSREISTVLGACSFGIILALGSLCNPPGKCSSP